MELQYRGKRLVVGLGNPGKKYKGTRHNTGHLIIDWLTSRYRLPQNPSVILVKTTVYMNTSGKQVKDLIDTHEVDLNNVIVIHDDVDITLGEYKVQFNKGSAGHKGIQSIIHSVGGKNFWRIRIGVGRPPVDTAVENYVLERFTQKEKEEIESLLLEIESEIVKLVERE